MTADEARANVAAYNEAHSVKEDFMQAVEKASRRGSNWITVYADENLAEVREAISLIGTPAYGFKVTVFPAKEYNIANIRIEW